MGFEILLKQVGEFGIHQKKQFFLLCLPAIFNGAFALFGLLARYPVEHRCSISNDDMYNDPDIEHQEQINRSIPYVNDKLSSCLIRTPPDGPRAYNKTVACEKWVFDSKSENVVTEFKLVCQKSKFRKYTDATYSFGKMAGCVTMGFLADSSGRKVALMTALILSTCSGIGLYFSRNIYLYLILSFINGLGIDGAYLIAYVIGLEMVGSSMRIIFAVAVEVFWSFGFFLVTLLALFVNNWRDIQLIITSLNCVLLLFCWLVPESARWLLASGRIAECDGMMQNIAKANGKQIDLRRFSDIIVHVDKSKLHLKEVMINPIILKRFFILCYSMFFIELVYNDLAMNTANKGALTDITSSLLAIACLIPLIVVTVIGRRILLMSNMMILGLAYIIWPLVQGSDIVKTLLIMVAKTVVVGSYIGCEVYASELFPTVVRSTGMGFVVVVSRIGDGFAPIVDQFFLEHAMAANLKILARHCLIGSLCMVGGGLALLLVETQNKRLPEKMDDVIETTNDVFELEEPNFSETFLASG